MQKILISTLMFMVAGCASTPQELFDPASDARVGEQVTRACYGGPGAQRDGGYIEIDGYPGLLVGNQREKFLLIFSRGCGNIGFGTDIPVFRNLGDNCRRQGEIVSTVSQNFTPGGSCTINRIYKWDEDAVQTEEAVAPSEEGDE